MDEPENSELLSALDAFAEAEGEEEDEALVELLETFAESQLYVAEDDELAYFETKDRQYYLAVFTDPGAARAFAPRHAPKPMTAVEALSRVARGAYSGLALNPGRHAFLLSAEDVGDFFELLP